MLFLKDPLYIFTKRDFWTKSIEFQDGMVIQMMVLEVFLSQFEYNMGSPMGLLFVVVVNP